MSHSFIRSFEFLLGGAVLNLLLQISHSNGDPQDLFLRSLPLLRLQTEEDLFTCSGPVGSDMGSFSGSFSGSENCRKYFVSCKSLFTYTWFSEDLLRFSPIRAIDLLGRPNVWGLFWNRWLLKCCFVICRVILRSWFWLVVYFADGFSQTCSDLMT